MPMRRRIKWEKKGLVALRRLWHSSCPSFAGTSSTSRTFFSKNNLLNFVKNSLCVCFRYFFALLQISHFATVQAGEIPSPREPVTVVAEKGAPLPIHLLDGGGGLVITPIAYLVNPGPEGTAVGLPSISASYTKLGKKNAETGCVTETFFRRLELGYSVSRFGLGTLVDDVRNVMGVSIPHSLVLHNFSARVLALEENSFGLPLPALTLGAVYKYNNGIDDINRRVWRVLDGIGYEGDEGVDFAMTATKALPRLLGRPLVASAGLRVSKAEQLGYFGFGDKYRPTFEGNLAYGITDWLWLAGEFRGNANAYQKIANPKGGMLVGRVDHWWALGVTVLYSRHGTVTVGWGHLGRIINTTENEALGLEVKYEF